MLLFSNWVTFTRINSTQMVNISLKYFKVYVDVSYRGWNLKGCHLINIISTPTVLYFKPQCKESDFE